MVSDEENIRGINTPALAEDQGCVFCRNCEYSCPDFAIYVSGEDKE